MTKGISKNSVVLRIAETGRPDHVDIFSGPIDGETIFADAQYSGRTIHGITTRIASGLHGTLF
jgi:hypothetical protein